MSDEQPIRTQRDGRILTITIDRQERRNALNAAVLSGLQRAFRDATDDRETGVIVLTGAGDAAFCAGADLGGIRADASKVEQHLARSAIIDVFDAMARSGKPIVARVNGPALAGGFGLLCACDLAIATDDATFGMPEVRSGLWPFIISAIVRERLPEAIALELMMTGRKLNADEAARWGVVNRIVPRAQLDDAVRDLCASLADKSAITVKLGKDSWNATRDMPRRAAMEHLHAMLGICLETEDVVEGITAFLQKREPVWKHR